jgi:hypothetical protein
MMSLKLCTDIVKNYASLWRYQFNDSKLKLIVFGDSQSSDFLINFGTSSIESTKNCKHVGIEIHDSFRCSNAVNARCKKSKSSLLSVLSIESEPGEVITDAS